MRDHPRRLSLVHASMPRLADMTPTLTAPCSLHVFTPVVSTAPRAVAKTRRVYGVGMGGAVLSPFISRATCGVDTKLMRNSGNLLVIYILHL